MTAAKSTAKTATKRATGTHKTTHDTAADVITLLIKDHRDVKKLFTAYQKLADADAPAPERRALAEQICEALTLHATAEEEIFYPAVRAAVDDAEDNVDEAEVEHAGVKALITQIQDMDPTDALYNAKLKVLGEYVDHHVKEEEGEMFPKAKKAELDLADLGEQVQARKDELKSTLH